MKMSGDPIARSSPKSRRVRALTLIPTLLLVAVTAALLFWFHLQRGPELTDVSAAPGALQDASIVFISGDTGLRSWSLGGRVAQRLAANGYPVVGVDTLAAFSTRRTESQTADLIARAMRNVRARNPRAPVVLIGQSFGADIIPIAVNRLPPDLKREISRIILIVPGSHAYLQVSPGEIAGITPPDVALAPLVRRLPHVPVTCIFGVEETDSLCPEFSGMPNATVIGMPGGHPLNRDSAAVFTVVSRSLREPRIHLTKT